ncbi:MAG: peroxiredoxin [Cyanobacteriota/Melainabacteria group bacterium]|nr:peroxiredoxin [Candidatus Obscuribacterales bacterium]
MLKAGQEFPSFELKDQNGKTVDMKSLINDWVVFYVYPKDDTPGCTIEGKQFSASKGEFDKLNTRVFGISPDGVDSHKDFCNKFEFTIDLLADTETSLLNALGVGQSEYKGNMYWNRVSFLVAPGGKIVKTYDSVKPDGHDQEVLKDLQALQKQPVS